MVGSMRMCANSDITNEKEEKQDRIKVVDRCSTGRAGTQGAVLRGHSLNLPPPPSAQPGPPQPPKERSLVTEIDGHGFFLVFVSFPPPFKSGIYWVLCLRLSFSGVLPQNVIGLSPTLPLPLPS